MKLKRGESLGYKYLGNEISTSHGDLVQNLLSMHEFSVKSHVYILMLCMCILQDDEIMFEARTVLYDYEIFHCRVTNILGNKVSSLTIKDVTRKCSVPSTHVYSGGLADRIPQGKIERSVQVLLY